MYIVFHWFSDLVVGSNLETHGRLDSAISRVMFPVATNVPVIIQTEICRYLQINKMNTVIFQSNTYHLSAFLIVCKIYAVSPCIQCVAIMQNLFSGLAS